MLTLGIETSGRSGSVALVEEGRLLEMRGLSPDRRHARTLPAELKSLFDATGRPVKDCGTVAVSIGPGSFTGLRVGVVCAKAFAYAVGSRIVAVDTFLAIAHRSPAGVDRVQVVDDAQRDDVVVGVYQREPTGSWKMALPIRLVAAEEWLAKLVPEDVVTGPWLEKHAARLQAGTGLPEAHWHPTADVAAQLGARQIAESAGGDDLWRLEPFYIRKSAAEEKLERR